MIAIRKHTTVDKDHRIEVTVESISIDAPEDYSVTYERALYGNLGANA